MERRNSSWFFFQRSIVFFDSRFIIARDPFRGAISVINLGGARDPIRNGFHFRSSRCDKVKLSLEPRMNIRSVQIIQKISQSAIFFYLLLEMVRFCHRIISICQIRLCKFLNGWSSNVPFFPILISKFLSTFIFTCIFSIYCCIKSIY